MNRIDKYILAMNPCPCGYYGDGGSRCHCTLDQVQRYRAKLSGPLLDRIDLHVEVPLIAAKHFLNNEQSSNTTEHRAAEEALETSQMVRKRVGEARSLQLERQKMNNSQLNNKGIQQHCQLSDAARNLLISATETLNFSPRAHHRMLKVARSIADLEANEKIDEQHMAEAISFRKLDRAAI